jgi:hypothetical protein
MAQNLAEELRVDSAMKHPGTAEIGRHKLVRSGPSVGGLIPKEFAKMLGALEAGETDVYVNYELGVVMHKIPEDVDDEGH